MKLDFLKENKKTISLLLLAFSALLGILILIKLTGLLITSGQTEKLINAVTLRCQTDPNTVEKYLAKSKEMAEKLKKKNLFAPPPPRKHPVSGVSGIFGKEALINGKWYKVGDKIGEAELLVIEPTQVKIKWDGKEKYFAPIASIGKTGPKKKTVKKSNKKNKQAKPMTVAKANGKTSPEPVAAAEEDVLAWVGATMSAQLRAKMLEKWNAMNDQEKEKAKQEWGKMSDEQKQQVVDQMEQNIDSL